MTDDEVRKAMALLSQPPMSRERFRQEAVLRMLPKLTFYEIDHWEVDRETCVLEADWITRAVFGEDGDEQG